MGQRVLITRPAPAAFETEARLRALGYGTLVAPFLVVGALPARLPGRVAACVITSANAAYALPGGVPVFAVGDATAARARDFTDAPVFSAAADAAALAGLIARECDPAGGALLLLAGRGQGVRLAADLRGRGFRVIRRVVYRAAPPAVFPEEAAEAMAAEGIDTVLFFSPETARAFVRLCPAGVRAGLGRVRAVTLSASIDRVLAGMGWREVVHAARPSQEALLELLGAA